MKKTCQLLFNSIEATGIVMHEENLLKALGIGRIVCDLAGAVVIFLKFLIKANDDFQMRSRQGHHLVYSEGMSSGYQVLDLD